MQVNYTYYNHTTNWYEAQMKCMDSIFGDLARRTEAEFAVDKLPRDGSLVWINQIAEFTEFAYNQGIKC